MPVLDALRTWQEYSGDDRVVPALTGWLAFLHAQPGSRFAQGWGSARVGDTLDTRLLALQPHRRHLPARPGAHHARQQRRLHPHDPDLAQRQPGPGLPGARAVRRAGRRPVLPGRDPPGLRHRDGRLRPVPRRRLRGRRERPHRLPRPAPGLRDLRHRRVHAQPRDAHPDHRRPGVGRPLRGAGPQHAAGRLRPAAEGHPLRHGRQQRAARQRAQVARPVRQRLRHAGVHARRPPVPLLPAQLRHGLAVLRRGTVAGRRPTAGCAPRCTPSPRSGRRSATAPRSPSPSRPRTPSTTP